MTKEDDYSKMAKAAADVVAKMKPEDIQRRKRTKKLGLDGEATFRYVPRSFETGAGRQHWESLAALFQRVREDCDAAAAEFGYPPQDDGLATLEYIALVLLKDVRAEQQKEKSAKPPPRRKIGPHERTRQFKNDWETIYSREVDFQRASPATLTKWIAELDENIRLKRTKAGKALSPLEVEQLREYRARLDERLIAAGKAKKPTKGQIKMRLAEIFVRTGYYGKPRGDQDARTFIEEKLKRARRSICGKRRGAKKK
jgi:hypothetical protein